MGLMLKYGRLVTLICYHYLSNGISHFKSQEDYKVFKLSPIFLDNDSRNT